ncbi:histidine kinase [Pseudomonas straminea]|uniref:histidine kinase n=1 Tax=Pseudomonas straminea TaxID=47882 RepID=A0A1I1U4Y6_PSEOC|nr:ATP-binding protein [Pseudomonas straminea]GLX13871.1 histidine kinase [Pseudomonas straminea]SFD65857.1 two-component system, NarL family, sensor histidine kinase BarA [Pseudomonas straminea]
MFKDIGIKGRVLMLTLLPTSLLALVLGGYFIWMQLSGLQAQLLQRGHMIAEQLAPLAAPALLHGDQALLQRIANQALEQQDVRAVTFLTTQSERLAHAGPSMVNARPVIDSDTVDIAEHSSQDATRFLMPVMAQHLTLSSEERSQTEAEPIGWVELELSHHNTLISGYRSLLTSLLLVVTGLIITGLLALRMSRSINDPLLRIKQGVALLKDGQLETRLPPLGSHELDELASGINRMAESLQAAQEEMQHSIDQVTEDLRQNMENMEVQNIELDFARKEALEASRIKSEFLANMSHEIRTPLNGILGFTNLLQKSELSPRQQDYLSTIEQSAGSLLSIINEVLDFSKIEAGKLVLENIPFNLRDLLQDTLTILAPTAHEKKLELLSLVYRDTPLWLSGDPLRLKQVLTNLVSNAIKFTREGSIVIRAMLEEETADSAQLRISVRDTGIGLADEDLRALFQAFSQADNSMTRQAGGTGLGLVISKRLIEQMGGEIGVDSTPGEGSEFWISLNLPKARSEADEQPRALAGRRVAMLEGRELARQALKHQLEDCGLQVSEFTDIDSLCTAVAQAAGSAQAFSCAVLGITSDDLAPAALGKRVWDLEELGCKSVVLCPTTEQALYQDHVPDWHSQLQAKPACTRRLQRALIDLVAPRQPRQATRHNLGRSPAILCVDDNAANLLLVQTLLDDMGAKVTVASSGFDALVITQEQDFDLVFMDVQMPGMDGRQTTEAIRQWEHDNGRTPMPIVALTAHALANEKRTLLQSGMDDYLTKPISERQLAQVVLKWTGLTLAGEVQEPQTEALSAPATAVLDKEEGLRLAAGKADLAADMLKMLLDGLPGDLAAIHQARADGDRNALIERIHRLHGATRYCGVPQLRAACQYSETQLKQDQPIRGSGLDELEQAIERLQQEAKDDAS